jgi:hypothetical protein
MSSHEFSKDILKLCIAQLIKDAGFDTCNTSVIALLMDIFERYLDLLAKKSQQLAILSNRNESNLLDFQSTLSEVSLDPLDLKEYWDTWGLRIPTTKRDRLDGNRGAGTGNAILEAILGIKKPTETKSESVKEFSGFFRLEPGRFPVSKFILSFSIYIYI